MMIRRGDIFYADLSPVVGSEQGGVRPVLVIQNNVGNRHKIVKNSVILLEQIRTIDKQRLKEYVCHIDSAMMQKVDKAIRISLEIAT